MGADFDPIKIGCDHRVSAVSVMIESSRPTTGDPMPATLVRTPRCHRESVGDVAIDHQLTAG